MTRIAGWIITIILTTTALLIAPTTATAASCSTGYLWLTHQNGFKADGVTKTTTATPAGTRFCPAKRPGWNDNDGPKSWSGWALNATSTRWVTATRIAPRGAGSGSDSAATARMIYDLADRYNVRVQFAERDNAGRAGYIRSTTWMLTGTYSASTWTGGKRGTGIIRIGVGRARLGEPSNDAAFRVNLKKTVLHEVGHVRIERHCGTTSPKIVGTRAENVTDAYASYYLGMTSANYGYTSGWRWSDLWRAKQIAAGNCG